MPSEFKATYISSGSEGGEGRRTPLPPVPAGPVRSEVSMHKRQKNVEKVRIESATVGGETGQFARTELSPC